MTTMIKRIFDFIAALIGLIILAPLFVLIAINIYLQIGRPILFAQARPGQQGKIFTFYKFRTMSDTRDQDGHLLPDADRLTPIGAFLRKTSLDELPQLFNILKGDMSFVGPRPLLVEYLDYYTPEQARRHAVKPGVTGWAQVNGRNTISWLEKCDLDIWYVDHQSLWLDMKILLMTVGKVLWQKDVSLSECPEASKRQIEAIKQAKRLSSIDIAKVE